MPDEDVSVLIVGGCLVSLTTAILLGHHGVPSLAVERHSGTAIHPLTGHFQLRKLWWQCCRTPVTYDVPVDLCVPEMLVTPVDLPVHPAHDPGFRATIGAHTDDPEHLGVNVGLDPRARPARVTIVSAQRIGAR